MATIPEQSGVIVWQDGSEYEHAGVYLGNGEVLESTPKAFDTSNKTGLVITQFKDKNKPNYRGTWTHWFEIDLFEYQREEQPGMILEILKEGMSFRNKPNGITFYSKSLEVGTKFEVVELPKEKFYDDDENTYYQWAKVRLNGQEGFVQYDHKNNFVIMYGTPTTITSDYEQVQEMLYRLKE